MQPQRLYQELKTLGLSPSYASQIAHGRRLPGLQLAIRIWRALGLKLGPVVGLSGAAIARLERLRLKRLAGSSRSCRHDFASR
jgi:hypothetical protein